jgi:hypothetical protein
MHDLIPASTPKTHRESLGGRQDHRAGAIQANEAIADEQVRAWTG